MTRPLIALFAAALMLLTAAPGLGATLSPVLQLTPRLEVRHDLDESPKYPLIFISRFGAGSKVGPWQARAVGQSTGRYEHGRKLQLYEGWLGGSGDGWAVRAGRQIIFWHEGRLMFHRRWRPQGITHDALRFRAWGDGWNIDAAVGKPFDEERPFIALRSGIRWGAKRAASEGLVDAIYIRDAVSWTGLARHTFGLWARLRAGNHTVRIEGYGQTGELGNGTEVSAWMGSLKLTTRTGGWRLSLYGDALSGDAEGAAKGSGSFHVLHGARHGFYGMIDQAYLQRGGPVDGKGLATGGVVGDWRDGPWRFVAHLCDHRFANLDELGTELDLFIRYKASKRASVVIGASALTDPPTKPKLFGYVAWLFNLGK